MTCLRDRISRVNEHNLYERTIRNFQLHACCENMKISWLSLSTALAQQFPSNPTRILSSTQDPRTAYVLQPIAVDSLQFSLSSVKLSGVLNPLSLNQKAIYGSLPFLSNSSNAPWNAVMNKMGVITVYTGSCGRSGQMWKLDTRGGGKSERGHWVQEGLSQDASAATGPRYLSSAITFSKNASAVTDDSDYYFFGGMCRWGNPDASNWQSAGHYSRNMVSLMSSYQNGHVHFQDGLATTRDPPIAQAGQSLTALPAAYSNHSESSQTKQQSFVLIGGHTEAAFINMSQIALWSLPQAAWAYFPVAEDDVKKRTYPTVRRARTQIEPRTGHTATLSSNGKKIVIIGGWVANTNTPAQPQIVMLNVASKYGGEGEWSWSVPETGITNGLEPGAGIYGHDAIMLNGDILLVMGGFSIAPTRSTVKKQGPTLNPRAYLLNTTSGCWLPFYDIPKQESIKQPVLPNMLPKTSQGVGIGVGLVLGAISSIALASFCLWYVQRGRRLNEEGKEKLQELQQNSHFSQLGNRDRSLIMRRAFRVSSIELFEDRRTVGQETPEFEYGIARCCRKAGPSIEPQSPIRGLSRRVSESYAYDKRMKRNMGSLEKRSSNTSSRCSFEVEPFEGQERITTLSNLGRQNLFIAKRNASWNHPLHSPPQYRQSLSERDQEMQEWVQDWQRAAAELMYTPDEQQRSLQGGNSSSGPSRRTLPASPSSAQASSLDQPADLVLSSACTSLSWLEALVNVFSTKAPAGGRISLAEGKTIASTPLQKVQRGSRFVMPGIALSTTRNLPDTARLMVEASDKLYSIGPTSLASSQMNERALSNVDHSRGRGGPWSFSRSKRNEGRSAQLNRTMTGAKTTSIATNMISCDRGDRLCRSLARESELSGRGHLPELGSADDASFLRPRRGARDWHVDDHDEPIRLQRPSESDCQLQDEDWDVERAANDREVQLMFTIPWQELRVVNVDDGEEKSVFSVDDH